METLEQLQVVALDCQTTGATPKHGHLLEMAWSRLSARDPSQCLNVQSHLLTLPEGVTIPRKISDLTGIRAVDLHNAVAPQKVWRRLEAEIVSMTSPAPAIIHCARFETPFIEALHRDVTTSLTGVPPAFPLDVICTLEIARRLFPGLPRRGLRALAGYFGFHAMQVKRAGDHVRATAAIWGGLVDRLGGVGVTTLRGLHAWLSRECPSRAARRSFPIERERRLSVPDSPGVYRLLGKNGRVLYLGKATSLKRRVNSYFHSRGKTPERTLELVSQVWDVDVTPTGSPLEAALMEVDEIKRLRPPYNVALRERSPEVWFASVDLGQISSRPGPTHPVGPLADRAPLRLLRQLCSLVEGGVDEQRSEEARRRILGLPRGVSLPGSCFEAGLRLLLERHGPDRSRGVRRLPAAVHLARLGTRLWRVRRLAPADDDTAGDDTAGDDTAGDDTAGEGRRVWTAARVADTVEENLVRATHLIRRAHWLCQLSEATVVWSPRTSLATSRVMIIESGAAARVGAAARGVAPGAPPGWRRGMLDRQRSFDAASYERLRVLTTELRRLVSEGNEITLRLLPGLVIRRGGLARRLFWF